MEESQGYLVRTQRYLKEYKIHLKKNLEPARRVQGILREIQETPKDICDVLRKCQGHLGKTRDT